MALLSQTAGGPVGFCSSKGVLIYTSVLLYTSASPRVSPVPANPVLHVHTSVYYVCHVQPFLYPEYIHLPTSMH